MFDRDTLPPLNMSLLVKQLDWAELSEKFRHGEDLTPEEDTALQDWGIWYQGTWATTTETADFCGTAYCQAGQAVVQAGYKPIFITGHYGQGVASLCTSPDGSTSSIEAAAAEVLGLTPFEAGWYFDGDNSLSDLRGYLNVFALRRGEPLPYPEVTEVDGSSMERLVSLLDYDGDV